MSKSSNIADEWEEMGQIDPKWGALTTPGKEQNWKDEEFLKTGDQEIEEVLEWCSRNSINISHDGNALDFGCGPRRLTLALARRFKSATGIDVSASMLEEARRLTAGLKAKCEFLQSEPESISVIGDQKFNFIYSNHVLQHIPPLTTKRILHQLFQALTDDGVLVFRVPYRRRLTIGKVLDLLTPQVLHDTIYRWRFGDRPRMRMHCIPIETIDSLVLDSNCKVSQKKLSSGAERWQNCLYAVQKI